VSVELKTAANIKYINIKMKKKLKNNSEIIYIIKDAGELCVKILLFLLCCDNLEKIDFEFMKSNVKPGITDDEIIKAVDFWKDKDILDYEITSVPNTRGANMDNIINIILNINRDINIISDEEEGDSSEFTSGLGIYDDRYINAGKNKRRENIIKPVKSEEPEKPEKIEKIEESEPTEIIEIIETTVQNVGRDDINELRSFHAPQDIDANEQNSPQENHARHISSQPVSIDQLSDALETKAEFRKLIHEIKIKMRTEFNTADLGIIYNLYETNGMEAGLILKLAEICGEEDKNNIRYLEKVALGNAASGIVTLNQYDEKLQEMYRLIEFEEKIKKLFKADDKKFTNKEKSYIKKWAKEFGFSDDVLSEGYNRCMKTIEKLSLDYINGIYANWHDKGFKTLDDINGEYGTNLNNLNKNSNKKNSGFDLEQHMEKLIKQRKERAEKL